MRNKLIILIVLFFSFLIFILIKFFITNNKNDFGELKVDSYPTTTIFLNNLAIGKTPYHNKHKTGEYLIKIIPEGTATDVASWNNKISIFKNTLTYINLELGKSDVLTAGEVITLTKMTKKSSNNNFGEIYIETEPKGAIVLLDNDEKGVAPLILEDVLTGVHEVSVYLPGFVKRTEKIKVISNYRVNIIFKLSLDESYRKIDDLEKDNIATESSKKTKIYVLVNNNPQGWLRVREDASINATEAAKIKTGEKFEFIEEKDGWYKIKFNGNSESIVSGSFNEGWVSKSYVTKIEE